jgi:hypothetical protein
VIADPYRFALRVLVSGLVDRPGQQPGAPHDSLPVGRDDVEGRDRARQLRRSVRLAERLGLVQYAAAGRAHILDRWP